MADDGFQGAAKTPADFLKSIKGRPVVVKLNSGVDYRGAQSSRTWRWSFVSSTADKSCAWRHLGLP